MPDEEQPKKKRLLSREGLRKLKEDLIRNMDSAHDNDCAKVRAKWMDRWAKLSDCPIVDGHYDYEQIDWDNEFIKLEWWMCDPGILAKLGNDKTRAEGILMLPEDVRDTYLYKTGPGCSKPYCEVYMGAGQVKHALSKIRKEKKKKVKP